MAAQVHDMFRSVAGRSGMLQGVAILGMTSRSRRLPLAMPEMLRLPRRARLVAGLGVVTLLAAACGSGSSTTEVAANPPATEAPQTTTANDTSESTTAAVEPEGEVAEAEPESQTNLFPNVDVVNVHDGSTLNLATELGGGDLPVLLWFWAPH